jgi:hypothetical protein
MQNITDVKETKDENISSKEKAGVQKEAMCCTKSSALATGCHD